MHISQPIPRIAAELLKEQCDVTEGIVNEGHCNQYLAGRDDLMTNVVGVDGLFCMWPEQIDEALLTAAGVWPGLSALNNGNATVT